MNAEQAVFGACLATADGRFAITKPFKIGGFVYATNGRVCARVSVEDAERLGIVAEVQPADGRWFPPADELDWHEPFGTTSYPVPAIEHETRVCEQCKGTKLLPEQCEECDGLGDTQCFHCGEFSYCDVCGGTGRTGKYVACHKCDGKGEVDESRIVPLAPEIGVWVASKTVEPLRGLGVRLRVHADARVRGRKPMLGELGAVRLMVMPASPELAGVEA